MKFDWLPILEFLQGKRVPWDGVLGFIDAAKSLWLEVYDGKIFAFPDNRTRHVISLTDAKTLYLKRKIQPTLFDL